MDLRFLVSKIYLYILGFLLAFASFNSFGHDHARLVFVQKNGQFFFLLPVTHWASTVDRDHYFDSVVKPAANKSGLLLNEFAPVFQAVTFSFKSGCPMQDQWAESAIQAADNAIIRYSTYSPWSPIAEAIGPASFPYFLTSVSYIEKVVGLFSVFGRLQESMSKQRGFTPAASVDHQLLQEHALKHASIESVDDWKNAFCASSWEVQSNAPRELAQRIDLAAARPPVSQVELDRWYVAALVELRDQIAAKPKRTDESLSPVVSASEAQLASARALDPLEGSPVNSFFLVERNKIWVKNLKTWLDKNESPFVAVGASHLVDNQYGPSLLTLLKAEGFQLELIRDHAHLTQLLALLGSVSSKEK